VRPTASATPAEAPKKRIGPVQFAQEVRAEARRITWTSWRETWITSVMVFIMVVVTAVFFLVVDEGLGQGMKLLLKLAA
jgi:preprotein translocase subunit SecE